MGYIKEQIDNAKPGSTVYLDGAYTEKIYVKFKTEADGFSKDKPLTIDGQGSAVINERLVVMDSHHIRFKNLKVLGGIEINDSYPEKGVKDIRFNNVQAHGSWSDRVFFMGGHNIDGVTLRNSEFLYAPGGTHAVYFSGGHWNPIHPPIANIKVIGCKIGYTPGGRHCLQFNGRFKGVTVENNTFLHGQLCGISLIGVQKANVRNNLVYGCNRGSGIVIYDYASHWAHLYNHFETEQDIENFKACHHPCQDIMVEQNTFVVGPKQFSVDPWHGDDPVDGHGAIHINNAVHEDYFPYPTKNIWIKDNLLHSTNLEMIHILHKHEASETSVAGNVVWSTKPGVPYINGYGDLKYAQGNSCYNPKFVQGLPEYDFVDMGKEPHYDWATHKSGFNPFSHQACAEGKGYIRPQPAPQTGEPEGKK